MKRKMKVYPQHLCIGCPRMTTNKYYCDTCLKIATNTRIYTRPDPFEITGDVVGPYRPSGHNESTDKLN